MIKVAKTVNDKVFNKMTKVDRTVNDLCCILGCSRSSLHVFVVDKILVAGNLKYVDRGDVVNCSKVGNGIYIFPLD